MTLVLALLACQRGAEDTAGTPPWELLHAADDGETLPPMYGPFVLEGQVWSLIDTELVQLDGSGRVEHGNPVPDRARAVGGDRLLLRADDGDTWSLIRLNGGQVEQIWSGSGGWPSVVGEHLYYWEESATWRLDLNTQEAEQVESGLFDCAEGPGGLCCHVTDFSYATVIDGVETAVVLTEDIFEPMLMDCVVHPSGEVSLTRYDGGEWWLERRDASGTVLHQSKAPPYEFAPDRDLDMMTQAGEQAWLSGYTTDDGMYETWAFGPDGIQELPGVSRRALSESIWVDHALGDLSRFSDGTEVAIRGYPAVMELHDGAVYMLTTSSAGGGIAASEYLEWLLTLGMNEVEAGDSHYYASLLKSTFTVE